MNLREFCRLPGLPVAITTTFNVDPLFFERVVLYDLIAGGARRIFLLADEHQALTSITAVQGQLVSLGRQYRLIPVKVKGSFHPKICVRFNTTQALVACGSHNLTRSGWLGCGSAGAALGNRESTTCWRVKLGTPRAIELAQGLNKLLALIEVSSDKDELASVLSEWLQADTPPSLSDSDPAWGIFGVDTALAPVLSQRWAGRKFDRLRILTGSTDHEGAVLRWAADTFGVREAVVEIDKQFCAFDRKAISELPLKVSVRAYDGNPRTHLKAALFEGPAGCAAIVGSANCSGSAWLRTGAAGGNVESVVIHDHCRPEMLATLFRQDQKEACSLQDIDIPAQGDGEHTPRPKLQLSRLELHRSSRLVNAHLAWAPPAGSRVFAIIQSRRTPLQGTDNVHVWCGPMPDIIEGPETLFGHVEVQDGELTQITNLVWVNDVDYLSHFAGRHIPFQCLRQLSHKGTSDDYKRLLEDLQVLSKVLLSQPSEFPDKIGGARKKSTAAQKPVTPVTAADVITTLDKIATPDAHVWSASPYTFSLTGIMRMLFGENTPNTFVDPTAAETEPKGTPDEPPTKLKKTHLETAAPTASQRKKLVEQLNEFKQALAASSFADTCSARQLHQAAAYPLAIAQFASRGPWGEDGCKDQLAQVAREVCEILFCRPLVAKDVNTGKKRVGPPLIEAVRRRYVDQQREADFDEIVGDGTLWLVLLGTLAFLRDHSTTEFEQNLLLCDIARSPWLFCNVLAERLAPLAKRLWQDAPGDVVSTIRAIVEIVGDLERHLDTNWKQLKSAPHGSVDLQDWLWNRFVSFAQVREFNGGGKAVVHIRRRQEDVTVKLDFYLNLRDLSRINEPLRRLFSACGGLR